MALKQARPERLRSLPTQSASSFKSCRPSPGMPNPDHLASRHDIPPPQPPPLWLFGEYQVRPEVSQLRCHKRFFLRQCPYCGKRALRNLRQCSLCKSVRLSYVLALVTACSLCTNHTYSATSGQSGTVIQNASERITSSIIVKNALASASRRSRLLSCRNPFAAPAMLLTVSSAMVIVKGLVYGYLSVARWIASTCLELLCMRPSITISLTTYREIS